MKPLDSTEVGLPSLGAVLAFMIDCLGAPKETENYSYKELERLGKGGLAMEKYCTVARKVMDGILSSFLETKVASQTIDRVYRQKLSTPVRGVHWQRHKRLFIPVPEFSAPPEAFYWRRNEVGQLADFAAILVHDWTEFMDRHEFLTSHCGTSENPHPYVVLQWACAFVVPFLAENLGDYVRNNSRFESGMPRGQFWYLPLLVLPTGEEKARFTWPINSLLGWWEDLLGCKLTSHASLLCAPGDEEDNARRQVHAWRYGDRVPDQITIERWCKLSWAGRYAGTFSDDVTLPLKERWSRCRAFLVKKGFHETSRNWLDGVCGAKEMFEDQYRGEMLEREILPFKEIPFAAFFESADPTVAGLPVAELIKRVAERYAEPTNDQLKTRLIVASAFQRAFNETGRALGFENAVKICIWFQQVYCWLIDLHNQATTRDEILRLIRNSPESKGGFRSSCEWLFDEDCWRQFPQFIRLLSSSVSEAD